MTSGARPHLAFLDGMRGLAAFYVMQYHALSYVLFDDKASGVSAEALFLLRQGHFGVVLFIVLSGYCLMLPVAKSGELRGGLREFIFRRAKRLLPPYFAVLFLCAVLLAVAVSLGMKPASELFDVRAWVTHLLLVHNLDPQTIVAINGPLWSVASEWQIYFIFPLVLLGAWRRWGNGGALAIGIALGVALAIIFPGIRAACPWFIGLFAMGMIAATVNFRDGSGRLARVPFGWLATAFFVGSYVLIRWNPHWVLQQDGEIPPLVTILPDFLVGIGCQLLILACVRNQELGRPSFWTRLLSSKLLVTLGAFSYSLYLIHSPIQSGLAALLSKVPLPFLSFEPVLFGCLLVASIIAGGVFFLMVERPFLHSRSGRHSEQSNLDVVPIDGSRATCQPARALIEGK
ncbi:MAG TPA: acyltransferase [Chthoniobacterales bacterium]|jgi:peptidoglycan/LPS O-acetylase OafA/YrhL